MGKRNPKDDEEMIDFLIENHQRKLTPWELDFIDNVHDRASSGIPLTKEQGETLDGIWRAIVVERLR